MSHITMMLCQLSQKGKLFLTKMQILQKALDFYQKKLNKFSYSIAWLKLAYY